MTKQLVIEQEIMNDAQKALDNEEFEVYLQPKTIIHTEECYGFLKKITYASGGDVEISFK